MDTVEAVRMAIFWLIGFGFIFDTFLDALNLRTWKEKLPENLAAFYTEGEYSRARSYHRDRFQFGLWQSFLSTLLFLVFLYFDGFAFVNELTSFSNNPVVDALSFFAALGLLGGALSIPFDYYSQFHIEEKYGFNRSDLRTFVLDIIKSAFLAAILGGLFIGVIISLFHYVGIVSWVGAWIFVSLLIVLINIFYTTWIMPLFNKLTPLPAGDLRRAIQDYSRRVIFPVERIMVMDGSKRSTKANAMFSGFGKKKTVILYDTLIEKHPEDELVAVLAHEVGHYKKKHIITGMAAGILQLGLTLCLLFFFMGSPELSRALGSETTHAHLGLAAFFLLYSPVSMILGLLGSILSRRNEYQADKYARETFGGEPLSAALKRMSVTHLSNLHPHPLYVFFHYSHPPVTSRIKHLETTVV